MLTEHENKRTLPSLGEQQRELLLMDGGGVGSPGERGKLLSGKLLNPTESLQVKTPWIGETHMNLKQLNLQKPSSLEVIFTGVDPKSLCCMSPRPEEMSLQMKSAISCSENLYVKEARFLAETFHNFLPY